MGGIIRKTEYIIKLKNRICALCYKNLRYDFDIISWRVLPIEIVVNSRRRMHLCMQDDQNGQKNDGVNIS